MSLQMAPRILVQPEMVFPTHRAKVAPAPYSQPEAKLPSHLPISRSGPGLSRFAFESAKACLRANWREKELGRF